MGLLEDRTSWIDNSRVLTKTGGKNDSNSGTEFHGETSRGRVQCQAVTKVAHDVVAISPDTEGNTSTTEAAVEVG